MTFSEVVKTLEESFSDTKDGLKHVEVPLNLIGSSHLPSVHGFPRSSFQADVRAFLPDKIDLTLERARAEVLAKVPLAQLKQAPETRESKGADIARAELARFARHL